MGYGSFSQTPIVRRSPAVKYVSITNPSDVIVVQRAGRIDSEQTPLMLNFRRQPELPVFFNWKIFTLLIILIGGVFIGVHLLLVEYNEWEVNWPFHMIDRTFWYQGEPIDSLNLPTLNSTRISHVVMFHTRSKHCYDFGTCRLVISELEKKDSRKMPFNFLIGGDGKTYELRGWNYQSGFDFIPFNEESLTVGLIGDFTKFEPSVLQIYEVEALIFESIRRRKLQKRFKIHGSRMHEFDGLKMFTEFMQLNEWAGWV